MDNQIPVPPLPGDEKNKQSDNLGDKDMSNNNSDENSPFQSQDMDNSENKMPQPPIIANEQDIDTGNKKKKIILIIVVVFIILVVGIFASIFAVALHSSRKNAKNLQEQIMMNIEKQNEVEKLEKNNVNVKTSNTVNTVKKDDKVDIKINADSSSNITIGNKQVNNNKKVKKYCNLPDKIQFDDRDFVLSWSNKVMDGDYLLEYVPLGDDVEHYHDMLTIECAINYEITVDEFVSIFVNNLDKEKQNDPFVHYTVYDNNDNVKIVDALLKDGDTIEWDMFRYQYLRSLIGQDGVIRFGFSKRVYKDEQQMEFVRGLKETRSQYMTIMSNVELEDIFEK